MGKKLLALLLTLLMVFSVMPLAIFAADESTPSITILNTNPVDTEEDLKAQLALDGSVKLGADIEVTSMIEIPAGVTVTLDLNGHTISQEKAQTGNYQMILVDGDLTVKDTVGGGKITYTDTVGGNFISNTITVRGSFTLESGTVENMSSEAVADVGFPYAIDTSIWGEADEVTVNIKGGKVYCDQYSAIRLRADSETEPVNVNITGGEVFGRIEVQNPSSDKATVGTLTVTGGTINKNNSSAAVMIFGGGGTGENMKVDVQGGDFTGAIGYSSYFGPVAGFDEEIISGGSFDTDVSDFVADGFEVVENADGSFGVAETVAKNIEVTDAEGNVTYLENFQGFNTSNVTLKLLADITDYNLNLNKATGVVLDLNGFTFAKQINLNNGAELTIKDSSAEKTGKITIDKVTNNTMAPIVIMRGTLTLEGGTVECVGETAAAIQASAATLNLAGGKLVSAGDGIQLGTWVIDNQKGSTVLSGTEIEAEGYGIKDTDKCDQTTVTVTGGKITSGEASLNVTTGEAIVSGGSFSTDVSEYVADGFEVVENADGTFGVAEAKTYVAQIGDVKYETLAEAIDAWKTNGGTLKLLANVGESITLNFPEEGAPTELTLDLNGFTVTSGESTLWVSDGYVVTVKDSSAEQTGKILSTSETDAAIAINRDGKVILNGGYVSAPVYSVFLYSGNTAGKEVFVMNGGEIYHQNGNWFGLGIMGGKATINGGKVTGDKIVGGGGWNIYVYENGQLDIKGGEFRGMISGITAGSVQISGGTFSYCGDPNDYFVTADLAPGYDVKVVDGAYVVYALPTSLEGSGTASDPYLINNLDDLKFFRDSVNGGNRYNGQFVKLMANIDLNDEEWTPIGDRNVDQGSFLGTFDGGGYVISNLWISEWTKTGAGFFSKVGLQTEYVSGTVKNVTFNNVTIISNESYVGVIAQAPLGALIENVHITGNIDISGYGYVGGIVGHGYPTIKDCSVVGEGDIIAHYWGVGAILGFSGDSGAKVSDVTVQGTGEEGLTVFGEYGGAAAVTGSPYGAALDGATVKNIAVESNSDYCMGYVSAGGTVENVIMENVTATANGNPITPADAVASVDGKVFFDLQEAIDAAEAGDEIVLLADVDMGTTGLKIVGKAVTLDLNGKTVSGQCLGGERSLVYVENGAKLTLKDSATGGKLIYTPTANGLDGYTVDVKGEFVLESGTVELAVTEQFTSWGVTYAVNVRPNEWGTPYTGAISFVMNGGKVVSADAAIRLASSSNKSKTVVFEMNGGSVEAVYDAVFVQQGDAANYDTFNVTVNGGSLTGRDVFRIYGMAPTTAGQYYNFALNGGTMTRTGDKVRDYLVGDILCANTGLGATVAANGKVTASAAIAQANAPVDGFKWVEENDVFVLTECHYVAEVDGVKFESLQAAIDAADGKTVVVLADVELTAGLTVTKGTNVTIDLNGKVISGVSGAAASSAVVTNYGTLTVKDSSAEGTGKITAFAQNPDLNNVPAYANNTITNHGTLNLYSGTIENSTDEARACFPIDNNSTVGNAIVNIYGGTVTGRGAIRQFANSTTYKNEVNILGGTVSGTSYAIWVQNPGSGDPVASLNIQGGTLDRVLLEASTSFDIAITDGTIKTVEIWEATDTDRDPAGFITGGTFSEAFDASFCEEGFAPAKNADGTYGVGKLPNAQVENIGASTVNPGDYFIYDLIGSTGLSNGTAPFDLQIIMQFLAKDSAEEAAANAFGNYTTDFFLSISGMEGDSIVADGCYLAGYYATYGTWVVIPLDGFEIENGEVYPVISAAGFDFSYEDICKSVKDFICGIYLTPEVLEANPDLKVNLELGLAEDSNAALNAEFTTVGGYEYTADELGTEYVAEIDTGDVFIKKFTTLHAAIDAAEAGDVIKLLDNVTLTEGLVVAADKAFTLDLNGKTVSYTTDVLGEFLLENRGNVTIDDSSDAKDGKLSFVYNGAPDTSYGKMNGTIQNLGTLTIKNGTVENASLKMSHANYAINTNAGATLNVEGGKVLNPNGHAIRMVSFGTALNTVNITGGYIEGTRAVNVQIPGSASATTAPEMALTITGGELKATDDVYALAVYAFSNGQSAENLTIDIEGGIFNGNVAINGAATTTMQANALAVTGGTFNGEYGVYSYADDAVAAPVIAITGGTFATNYCEYYAIDDGFGFELNTEGTYNVVEGLYAAEVNGVPYATLEEALRAATAGQTVTVLADVDMSNAYAIVQSGTILDLNGHTVKAFYAAAFGQIIDSGETKGLLEIAKDNLAMTQATYPMLPVYNEAGTGYVFVSVKPQMDVLTEDESGINVPDDGFTIRFRPSIKGGGIENKQIFGDGVTDNALTMKVYIHCYKDGVKTGESIDFMIGDQMISDVYNASDMAVGINVRGAAGVFDSYQVELVLESATGVAFSTLSSEIVLSSSATDAQ